MYGEKVEDTWVVMLRYDDDGQIQRVQAQCV